jgi:hypothetical protein
MDGASIVLVMPESAVSQTFITFINRKLWSHKLDQIVIDECHVILNDWYNFHKEMGPTGGVGPGEDPDGVVNGHITSGRGGRVVSPDVF